MNPFDDLDRPLTIKEVADYGRVSLDQVRAFMRRTPERNRLGSFRWGRSRATNGRLLLTFLRGESGHHATVTVWGDPHATVLRMAEQIVAHLFKTGFIVINSLAPTPPPPPAVLTTHNRQPPEQNPFRRVV